MTAIFVVDASVSVTDHAVEKWRAYSGSEGGSIRIKNKIVRMYKRSKEVYLKKQYRVKQLLNHKCRPARYFKIILDPKNSYIFVTDENRTTIITIHDGAADKWVDSNS